MGALQKVFSCEKCGEDAHRDDVIRTKTMADLNPKKWQTFCCPNCGSRIKTVFVALETAHTKMRTVTVD